MCDVFQAGGQGRHQLLVKRSSHFGGVVGTVDGDNIVVFATFQLGYEVLTRAGAVLLKARSSVIATPVTLDEGNNGVPLAEGAS